MKKYLLLLASAALLLVGCSKEQLSNGVDGGMTSVTFTTSLDGGVATKADIDNDGKGTNVNRCIMEIYFQNELYKRMEAAMSGTPASATFSNVPVVAGKEYEILFWADHVDVVNTEAGLATDKYYTTKTTTDNKGLKAVTVKKADFIDALKNKKNDELDAFSFADKYTVPQGGKSYTAKLKRPFAQLNVITTDVAAGKTVTSADLLPETVTVSYTAATIFNVADSTATESATYEYTAPVYGDKTNWTAVKNRGELTLSMDYLLASTEQELVNVTFVTKNGGQAVMTHNLTNLPYQRNYRTNVKGELLTTGGTWKAEIEPKWGNGTDTGEIDHIIAANYTDVVNALQSGNDSKNMKVTVTPAAVNNLSDAEKAQVIVNETIDGAPVKALKFVLYEEKTTGEDIHHASPEHVEFELPARPADVAAWKIEYEPAYPTETVVVSTKEENDANVIIEAPKSTVTLEATKINSVVSTTSENTLIIPQGLELKNLTVKKGSVEYHGAGLEKVTVAPLDGAKVYFKTSEGLANTDAVYGVVKNYVAPGYAITREPAGTWKIVPEVCKIGTKSYATLIDAVDAVQSGETIELLKDYEGDGVVIPSGKSFTLDFGGHTYKVIGNLAGSAGTKNQCFQLLKGSTLVFQNGTITTSCAKLGINTYSDVTIKNVTIDMSQTEATGQVACLETCNGTVSVEGESNLITKEDQIATLVLYWPNGGYGDIDVTLNTTGEVSGLMAYGSYQVQDLSTVAQHSHVAIKNGKYDVTFDMDGLEIYDYKISGGVFTNKPGESLVADKYEITENTDAATKDRYPWTIVPGSSYVAQIGSELYTSVQEAFKASKDNETIVLLKDTNRGSDQYTSKCGNNITFDLNGHKIESNNGQGVFHFQMSSYKTINFVDTKGNGGLVQLDSNPSSDTYGAICANGANVNIYAGYYETTPAYHGWTQVLYAKDGNITVYDGTFVGDLFTDNQWHHMMPEWAPEANTIEIFGGVFTGKVLDSYAEDGVKSEVVIHGGKFSFNPTDYLAQGEKLVAEQGEDGYWTVSVEKIRAVDLGLSVEWGDRNVGASDMFGHGDYFAWGETVARADAGDWSLYKYYDESSNTVTKYNTTDQIYVLKPEDDAASENLGGGWRMPTKAEMEELFNNCQKEKVSNYLDSGINGLLFTAPNGQTLFIPTSGNIWDQLYNPTTEVCFWCADKPTIGSAKAYALDYISNLIDKDTGFSRCGLMPVRPVRSK